MFQVNGDPEYGDPGRAVVTNVRVGRFLHERAGGHMNGPLDIGDVSPWRYFGGAGLAIGLVLGLSMPDSPDQPGWLVTGLWVIQSLVTIGLLLLMQQFVQRIRLPGRQHPVWQLTVSGLLTSLLLAPPLLYVDIVTGQNPAPATTGELLWSLLDELTGMGPPVILAWLAMNAPFILGLRLTVPDRPPVTATAPAPFMQLLSADRRGELISLQAELHYLKVNTDQGSSLILYNLKDAIDELPADMGIQCHRSHWVALNAVERFRKTGRQGQLLMTDGGQVPVSRSCVSLVEASLAARIESAATTRPTATAAP